MVFCWCATSSLRRGQLLVILALEGPGDSGFLQVSKSKRINEGVAMHLTVREQKADSGR